MKTRIAVLVSGGGTNLQALLDAQTAGRIPHGEIALVVSNHAGAYALERAKGAGVPAAVVSKKECGSQAAFEHRLQGILELDGIDMIILAGFMSILSENFTKKWPNRILNIHPSLIPAFCGEGFYGLHVHEAALSRGVKVTGATVHFVNEIPDGGEIIAQARAEGRQIIVLAGRPYHADEEINHGIDKLICSYGAAVITEDSISHLVEKFPTSILNQWTYHSRLYAAAKYIADQPDMNLVQLVSFGCGVDAITTDETREILQREGKLYTQIKIDEIANLGAVNIRLRSLFAAIEPASGETPDAE